MTFVAYSLFVSLVVASFAHSQMMLLGPQKSYMTSKRHVIVLLKN